MSASAILIPLALSIISGALSASDARKRLAAAPQNNGVAQIETRFNDASLLVKTLNEHGIQTFVESENRIITQFAEGRITYIRASEGAPFIMEVSEVGDIQCLLDELETIETEYQGNVQSYTYERVINNLPDGMTIESEQVLDDNSIVITLNVE